MAEPESSTKEAATCNQCPNPVAKKGLLCPSCGGKARAQLLTAEQRSEIARKGLKGLIAKLNRQRKARSADCPPAGLNEALGILHRNGRIPEGFRPRERVRPKFPPPPKG